jgi:alpha-L-fucosidase
MNILRTAAVLALLVLAARGEDAKDFTKETPEEKAARMAWFNEAKFGMFIHWGLYAVPAGEYKDNKGYGEWFVEETKMPMSQYEQYAGQFNPVKFNAAEWVRTAKGAGMRYICITSKHHDGFGLWKSELGDWNIGRTPFKEREPLRELADACKAEGLTFCLYHSIMDWHHERYGQRRAYNDTAQGDVNMAEYVTYMNGQLKEIITRFGPLGILWFDGGWEKCWTGIPNHGPDLYSYVRGLQPSIIVNDRGGHGDYGTPEQTIPGAAPKNAWETCMTLNGHWGYNKNDQNWKSTTTLIRNLIDCASKGGNYLLNVGPTGEGLIPFESVTRLQQVGAWMKQNGSAVYGTTTGPFRRLSFGRATTKGHTLNLFVFDVPPDRKLQLPGLAVGIKRAWLLADPKRRLLEVTPDEGGPIVTLPAYPNVPWNEHANVVVCECDGVPQADTLIAQKDNGPLVLKAVDATVEGEGPASYESGDGKDNIGMWTSEKNSVTWAARLSKAGRYKVTIDYACPDGTHGSAFEIAFGGRKVTGTVEATGTQWNQFAAKELGAVELGAGRLDVRVTPLTKPGFAVMNLRSIKLAPATP